MKVMTLMAILLPNLEACLIQTAVGVDLEIIHLSQTLFWVLYI